jgi:hypothetical protein
MERRHASGSLNAHWKMTPVVSEKCHESRLQISLRRPSCVLMQQARDQRLIRQALRSARFWIASSSLLQGSGVRVPQ